MTGCVLAVIDVMMMNDLNCALSSMHVRSYLSNSIAIGRLDLKRSPKNCEHFAVAAAVAVTIAPNAVAGLDSHSIACSCHALDSMLSPAALNSYSI